MTPTPLRSTFLVLDAHQACTPVPVTPSLYADLDAEFGGFKGCALVAEYGFSADWDTWEMHPAGDEVLYLLEGRATLVLREGEAERSLTFDQPGSCVVIPRGVWHTARVSEPCRMVFITPGEGTRNARDPRAPDA